MAALDLLSWALLVAGGVVVFLGGVGVLRFPDLYTRLHAAGLTDTLGAGLIILGLTVQAGWSPVAVKLALIWLFLFLTSPVSSHALARAARTGGLEPWRAGDQRD